MQIFRPWVCECMRPWDFSGRAGSEQLTGSRCISVRVRRFLRFIRGASASCHSQAPGLSCHTASRGSVLIPVLFCCVYKGIKRHNENLSDSFISTFLFSSRLSHSVFVSSKPRLVQRVVTLFKNSANTKAEMPSFFFL